MDNAYNFTEMEAFYGKDIKKNQHAYLKNKKQF